MMTRASTSAESDFAATEFLDLPSKFSFVRTLTGDA